MSGAGYLIFPRTSFWWLDYYGDFKRHLDERYETVFRLEEACHIYRLDGRRPEETDQVMMKPWFDTILEDLRRSNPWYRPPDSDLSDQRLNDRSEGVNVCGYWRDESGWGAAGRRYLRALSMIGMPLALMDLSDLTTNRSEDRTCSSLRLRLPPRRQSHLHLRQGPFRNDVAGREGILRLPLQHWDLVLGTSPVSHAIA